jgi:hypothetical protein
MRSFLAALALSMVLAICAVLAFAAVFGRPVHARDLDGRYAGSPLSEWYNSLKAPDTGGSCCGEADAVEADEWLVHADGSVTATVTNGRGYAPDGMKVDVPAGKVLRGESNPTGHTILFLSRYGSAWCLVIGGAGI